MNKVIKIKDDNIDEEASLWISRLDRGLSESERLDLNDWLDLSTRHNRVQRRNCAYHCIRCGGKLVYTP